MKVDGSLLKDLDVFQAVVASNGITNAEYVLNKDASTISRSLSALEARTGMVLCERGRGGFKLTEEGGLLLEEANRLFRACESFEQRVAEISQSNLASLNLGVIDNIILDALCPLRDVLQQIAKRPAAEQVKVELVVKTPYELERELLAQTLDMAIGIFESKHNALEYFPLYQEVDHLYTASHSELAAQIANAPLSETTATLLSQQNFCARNFLNQNDLNCLGFKVRGETSYSNNLEAIMFKILAGNCIGFIPSHYAQHYVDLGLMRPIYSKQIVRYSTIDLVCRRGESDSRKLIATMLGEFTASTT